MLTQKFSNTIDRVSMPFLVGYHPLENGREHGTHTIQILGVSKSRVERVGCHVYASATVDSDLRDRACSRKNSSNTIDRVSCLFSVVTTLLKNA